MKTEVLVEMLPIFEGRTSWMYLDSDGTVTVGVGHALFAPIDWIQTIGLGSDSGVLLTDEWNTVKAAVPGKPANDYAALSKNRLTDIQIDSLLVEDLADAKSRLARLWPTWRGLPAIVQDTCTDMAFNLGATKLLREFPKFIGALSADPPDYKTAAAECVRIGVQPERNEWTKACLLSAAEREG